MKTPKVFQNQKTGKPENVEYLRSLVDHLKWLLNHVHPTSKNWTRDYSETMQKISDYWNSEEPGEDDLDREDLGDTEQFEE